MALAVYISEISENIWIVSLAWNSLSENHSVKSNTDSFEGHLEEMYDGGGGSGVAGVTGTWGQTQNLQPPPQKREIW